MSDLPLHHWVSRRKGFLERTLADLTLILDRSYATEAASSQTSALHRLDARVKVASAAILTIQAASASNVSTIAWIVCGVATLAMICRIPPGPILRLWATVGVLAAMLAVPAIFMTPGRPVYRIPLLSWTVTDAGVLVASKLVLRALASSTIGAVLVLSTSWQYVLKAMRRFGIPVIAVVLVAMTYRYIVLFLHTAIDMMNARKSRTVGRLPFAARRRLALSSLGVLLDKAFTLGSEVHLAMQARGFRGEISVMDEFAMRSRDWVAVAGLAALDCVLVFSTR